MTIEKVIQILKSLWCYKNPEYSDTDIRKALDIAINSLEKVNDNTMVEREKIDKAIEKIENYTPCIEDENMRYAFECVMGKTLEIIKRNIGESK